MDDPAYLPFLVQARERDDLRMLRFFGESKALLDHQSRLEQVWKLQTQEERYAREQRESLVGRAPSSKL